MRSTHTYSGLGVKAMREKQGKRVRKKTNFPVCLMNERRRSIHVATFAVFSHVQEQKSKNDNEGKFLDAVQQ